MAAFAPCKNMAIDLTKFPSFDEKFFLLKEYQKRHFIPTLGSILIFSTRLHMFGKNKTIALLKLPHSDVKFFC